MSALALSRTDGLRYGLVALPLAFAALPLYVHLPPLYAQHGVPLAMLGGLLLLARLFDAVTDPWLGRWWDRVFARGGAQAVWRGAAGLAVGLLLALSALLLPPNGSAGMLAAWALVGLALTSLAYSALTLAHQSWGTRLGGDAGLQAQVAGWREGCALVGVLLAALLPPLLGWPWTLMLLGLALVGGLLAWRRAPRPPMTASSATPSSGWTESWLLPWRQADFRRLALIYTLSALASAIPATLVLFFITDRLQAHAWQGALLAIYFLAAGAGLPLWLRLVAPLGLARTWALGMVVAVAAFAWTATLHAGDVLPFVLICALSGLALGADLALPPALLAMVVTRCGHHGQREGLYFGWWNLLAKGALALAAGLALPMLQALGYQPGQPSAQGLQALTTVYAVLPCALKVLAAGLLLALGLTRSHRLHHAQTIPSHPSGPLP